MVIPPEAAFVHLFAADIRRIIVEEGTRSVIMVNKHLEVLICRFSAFDIFWEHLFFGCSKSAKKPDLIGLFCKISFLVPLNSGDGGIRTLEPGKGLTHFETKNAKRKRRKMKEDSGSSRALKTPIKSGVLRCYHGKSSSVSAFFDIKKTSRK